MTATTTLFLSYLLIYKYVALFVIIFAVAIVVPLPANVFLLAAGAFSSLGYLSFPLALLVAVVANVAGDVVDFLLARHFGPKILTFFHIRENSMVVRIETRLRDHAPITIFASRFAGPIDLIVSLSAGIAQVKFTTFLLYDFLGNFLSNVLVVGIGYFAGISWQNFSGTVDLIGAIILVVIVIIFVIWSLVKRRRRKKSLQAEELRALERAEIKSPFTK